MQLPESFRLLYGAFFKMVCCLHRPLGRAVAAQHPILLAHGNYIFSGVRRLSFFRRTAAALTPFCAGGYIPFCAGGYFRSVLCRRRWRPLIGTNSLRARPSVVQRSGFVTVSDSPRRATKTLLACTTATEPAQYSSNLSHHGTNPSRHSTNTS